MANIKTQNSKAEFCKRLTAAKEAINLTKQKIGEVAGVNHLQFVRYEKGAAKPAVDVIKK